MNSYASAQRRYLAFCEAANLPPLPLSEGVLCIFVAFLANQGLAHQSITSYLSGVRNLAVADGYTPPNRDQWPRLQLVLRGVARSVVQGNTVRPPRLPITGVIMHQLAGVWSGQDFQSRLMWAATCVGYFGFMRVGEFTAVDSSPPNIVMSEVAINSRSAPTAIRLRLHRAKTDPFGRGVEIFMGVSGTGVCPVSALLRYLAVRPLGDGHLFVWEDGRPLTRSAFVTALKQGLRSAGLDMNHFSGHSLRIGAATSAAAAGVPDHLIKILGRWQSEAYQLYIRTPRESLLGVARLIGSHNR